MTESNEERIIESLSPIERNLLRYIKDDFLEINSLLKLSEQDLTTAIRAAGFLKNKGLVETTNSSLKTFVQTPKPLNFFYQDYPHYIL